MSKAPSVFLSPTQLQWKLPSFGNRQLTAWRVLSTADFGWVNVDFAPRLLLTSSKHFNPTNPIKTAPKTAHSLGPVTQKSIAHVSSRRIACGSRLGESRIKTFILNGKAGENLGGAP